LTLKKNISAYSVLDYNQCKYKTSLDFINPPDNFSILNDPWLEIVRKIGIEHEKNFISKLEKNHNVTMIDDSLSFIERKNLTEKAIKSKDEIIYQGVLVYEHYNGIPDLLVRKGNYYEPCDIKSSFSLKSDNIMQVCHYAFLLKKQFNLMPKTGMIILRDESEHEVVIDKYFDYYMHISEGLENFLMSDNINIQADKCSLCIKCKYKLFCENNWEKSDHLNQISNIRKDQIKILNQNGINTLIDFSKAKNVSETGLNPKTSPFMLEQAKLQVNYKKTGKLDYKIIFDEKRKIIDNHIPIGFELLPKKNPNDLFFDIEGYPMFIDQNTNLSGLEYLFGVHYRIFDNPSFKKFLSINHKEEKKSFEDLIDFFYKHIKEFPNASIYHYGSYEITAIQNLSQKYDNTKFKEVDYLLRSKKFVDLYKIIKDSILLSTSDYKLKTIEKFYDFSHDSEVSSGEDSLVAFEHYIDSGSEEIIKNIITYNKLDCESTEKLRDWILGLKPKNFKAFVPPPIKEPTDELKERIAEESKIYNSIDNEMQLDEELNTTFKSITNYGQKQLRPKWWEFFNNLKKDDSELIDDSSCIGQLKPIKETIIGTGRNKWIKKNITFSFPKQVVKLKTRDSVEDSNQGEIKADLPEYKKIKIQKINQIDYAHSIIDMEIWFHPEADKAKYVPYGIIPRVTYFDRVPDTAVKKFLSNYLYPNSFPAIKEFLDKKDPKYKSQKHYKSTESINDISERIENLNNSYLFLQGPPGTGKTYTSSRVIINLMKKKYKVAILCNSHDAIINLLNSVDSYAQEIGYEFKGVYRRNGHPNDRLGKNIEVRNKSSVGKLQQEDFNLFSGTASFLASPTFNENSEINKSFDFIFFDEAGQLSLSHVIASSMAAKNIILVGDHMQLPRPSSGAKDEGNASLSPVEYIMGEKNTIDDSKGIFLEKTFRMHSKISQYISDNFYEQRLKPDKNNDKQNILINKKNLNGIYLLDLDHKQSSVQNEVEANYIKNLYERLIGKKWIDKNESIKTIKEEDILVVSPFNAQVNLIKEKLSVKARVGTIDIFQGQESPIVIASYATSSPEEIGLSRGSDFFFDFRRLNVSLSRARSLAIILFNKKLLNYNCSNIEDIERLNYFCKLKKYDYNPEMFLETLD
jgi:uncharacterized protein